MEVFLKGKKCSFHKKEDIRGALPSLWYYKICKKAINTWVSLANIYFSDDFRSGLNIKKFNSQRIYEIWARSGKKIR